MNCPKCGKEIAEDYGVFLAMADLVADVQLLHARIDRLEEKLHDFISWAEFVRGKAHVSKSKDGC